MTTTQETQSQTPETVAMMPVADHEQFKRDVVQLARRYAQRHNWCEVVDQALEEMGLINQFVPKKVGLPHIGVEAQLIFVPEDRWPANAEEQVRFINRYLTVQPTVHGMQLSTLDWHFLRLGPNRRDRTVNLPNTVSNNVTVADVSDEEIRQMQAQRREVAGNYRWLRDSGNPRSEVTHLVAGYDGQERNDSFSLCERANSRYWRDDNRVAYLRHCQNCVDRAYARGITT